MSVRIRKPFLAAFTVLTLAAGYLGLGTQKIGKYGQSDKALHFVTFLLLTVSFYWILDTSRRRVVHLSLLLITAGAGIGSELAQALLPNDRKFDPYDVLANCVGSGLGVAACSWYHKRMLERRRKGKHYDVVPGEEPNEDIDVELGEGVGGVGPGARGPEHGLGEQEVGVVSAEANGALAQVEAGAQAKITDVTDELDNWDEHAEDWDEDAEAEAQKAAEREEVVDPKKRTD